MTQSKSDIDNEWKSITHGTHLREDLLKATQEGLPTMLMMHGAKPKSSAPTSADSPGDKTRQASAEATEQDRSTRTSTTRRKSLEQEAGAGIWETEVETYATHLGMDLKEDRELLWIAEQAVLAPLPPHWTEVLTQTDATAFQNVLTGVLSWKHPLEDQFRSMYQYHKAALRGAAAVKLEREQPTAREKEEGGDHKVEGLDGDSEDEPFSGPSSLNTTRGRLLTSGNLQEEMQKARTALRMTTQANGEATFAMSPPSGKPAPAPLDLMARGKDGMDADGTARQNGMDADGTAKQNGMDAADIARADRRQMMETTMQGTPLPPIQKGVLIVHPPRISQGGTRYKILPALQDQPPLPTPPQSATGGMPPTKHIGESTPQR
eukprot:CAMPEP_0198220126 /NCGR_PEP_ID=MMETSP1445-20131203/77663_1 /TAXON_ID=36898 /ORGANISM="Pyramimonas sp., Strain CCMP2087" /LENGTH=377 /DNA_ID=CAMNT_0043897783 /DNA_START=272 /DNA_END=1402 /DNA_ORIENTATION=-